MPSVKAKKGYALVEPIFSYQEYKVKGIEIPTPKINEIPKKGRVFDIGKNDEGIKIGDVVLFNEQSPRGFKLNGKSLIAININNIQAICE